MTKEQVGLAMGSPATFLKINGDDAWVYVHQQYVDISPRSDSNSTYGSGFNSQRNFTETAKLGPRPSIYEKTTIFFRGDRASHARITLE
jgi:outer membrane protein assembly factor BamE (lipoprotein component of BamABCDE complex)